jgi:hypothetical protein
MQEGMAHNLQVCSGGCWLFLLSVAALTVPMCYAFCGCCLAQLLVFSTR